MEYYSEKEILKMRLIDIDNAIALHSLIIKRLKDYREEISLACKVPEEMFRRK